MKISFYGADKEVTGSCHCVEAANQKFLVDCGLRQGGDERENNTLPFLAGDIDFVIVTHAHIDHSGRLRAADKKRISGEDLCYRSNLQAAFDYAAGQRSYSGNGCSR